MDQAWSGHKEQTNAFSSINKAVMGSSRQLPSGLGLIHPWGTHWGGMSLEEPGLRGERSGSS